MSVSAEAPVIHEMATADGSYAMRSEFTPGYVNKAVIEVSWLAAETGDINQDTNNVYRAIAGPEVVNWLTNRDWLDFVYMFGPDEKDPFIVSSRIEGIGKALGFSLETTRAEDEDGRATRTKTYTYPSIEHVNDFMKRVFGENQLQFVPFEGSEYSAQEFMQEFIKGRVLIATEQPHALHDLTDHLMGWIALDPDLIKLLKERLAYYTIRAEDEQRLLPYAPTYDKHGAANEDQIKEFLNPSLLVVRAAMANLDGLTAQISEASSALPEVVETLGVPWSAISYHLENFFGSLKSPNPSITLPRGLLGSPGNYEELGKQSYKRLLLAHEVGTRIVAENMGQLQLKTDAS